MSELSEFADGAKEFVDFMLNNPRARFSLQLAQYEIALYGLEAIAFAENCETKDYSILWEEWAEDKAEFQRLADKWQARVKGE